MAEVLELNNTNGELMHAGSRPHLSHDQEFCCPKRRLEVQLSEVRCRLLRISVIVRLRMSLRCSPKRSSADATLINLLLPRCRTKRAIEWLRMFWHPLISFCVRLAVPRRRSPKRESELRNRAVARIQRPYASRHSIEQHQHD